MKNMILHILVALTCFSTSAYAAQESAVEGGSFLLTLFIGFFALIIVFQLVPATILFISMLRGLFVSESKVEKNLN